MLKYKFFLLEVIEKFPQRAAAFSCNGGALWAKPKKFEKMFYKFIFSRNYFSEFFKNFVPDYYLQNYFCPDFYSTNFFGILLNVFFLEFFPRHVLSRHGWGGGNRDGGGGGGR